MKDIYAEITERIIAKLSSGTIPWQMPWTAMSPMNLVSRQPYHGINFLTTAMSGFASPYWLTFHQAQELGGTVKKGSKATPILFWKFLPKKDEDGNLVLDSKGRPKTIPFERHSNVFNLEQTEGVKLPEDLAAKASRSANESIQAARQVVKEARMCPIQPGADKAAYSPTSDVIVMPFEEAFRSPEDYYHTLWHEMAHATGHQSRLDRRDEELRKARFGSEAYAQEELVAELTAAFLSHQTGILDRLTYDNPVGYIQSWIWTLKNDVRLVVKAAGQAQKAADWINGIPVHTEQTVSEFRGEPEQGPLPTPATAAFHETARPAPTRGVRF